MPPWQASWCVVSAGVDRRRWGWYRLADSWAARLVADADVQPNMLVLDIGAGDGTITAPLVDAGARVVAFELHSGRRRELHDRFADGPVTIVRADIADLRLPRRPFRVVANPPFAVASPLLRRLLAPGSRLEAADLVLPRSVANRWVAGRAPGVNRWANEYDLRLGRRLPRSAFTPRPTVDCVVLTIRRRKGPGRPRHRSQR